MVNKLLEVIKRTDTWSQTEQEALAQVVVDIDNRHQKQVELTDDDWNTIDQRIENARKGAVATDNEVKALFDKYRSA